MKSYVLRTVLVALFAVTGMPLITAAGLFFGAVGIAHGFSFIYAGQVLRGIFVGTVWTFAFFGLFTLWSLAKRFWRNPFANPTGAQLRRNLIGLGMGLTAIPGLWTPAVIGDGAAAGTIALAALFPIPAALFFVVLLSWNRWRSEKHAIARAS
jgi:hypothetical protein